MHRIQPGSRRLRPSPPAVGARSRWLTPMTTRLRRPIWRSSTRYWGLPKANFTVVYANSSFGTLNGLTADCSGTPPPANANFGWDIEESLDIEWAHVMAPAAHIILVEACDQSLPQLLFAEEVAGLEVSKNGGGDISNSWGYPESCVGNPSCGGGTLTEQQDDNYFFRYYYSQISYFASAGDIGSEVLFPSASPWVVSAGGTTVNRDASGNFLSESCWSDSGGGLSTVEAWQNPPTIANGMGPWSKYQYQMFGGAPYNFLPYDQPRTFHLTPIPRVAYGSTTPMRVAVGT